MTRNKIIMRISIGLFVLLALGWAFFGQKVQRLVAIQGCVSTVVSKGNPEAFASALCECSIDKITQKKGFKRTKELDQADQLTRREFSYQ